MVTVGIVLWLTITVLLLSSGLKWLKQPTPYVEVEKGILLEDGVEITKASQSAIHFQAVEVIDEVTPQGQTITTVTITSTGMSRISPILAGLLIGIALLYVLGMAISIYRNQGDGNNHIQMSSDTSSETENCYDSVTSDSRSYYYDNYETKTSSEYFDTPNQRKDTMSYTSFDNEMGPKSLLKLPQFGGSNGDLLAQQIMS